MYLPEGDYHPYIKTNSRLNILISLVECLDFGTVRKPYHNTL